jgi:hypothetical protein
MSIWCDCTLSDGPTGLVRRSKIILELSVLLSYHDVLTTQSTMPGIAVDSFTQCY